MSYRRSRSSVKSRSRKRGRVYVTRARPIPQSSRRTLAAKAVELKHYDCIPSSDGVVAISNNGDMTGMASINPPDSQCLFAPKQGPGSQDRDGRLATVHSIYISGTVYVPQWTVGQSVQTVFLALVLDRSPNLHPIQGSTNLIYQNLAMTPGVDPNPDVWHNAYAVTPLRNLEWSKRFKVLKTKTLTFNPNSAITGDATQYYAAMNRSFTMTYRPSGPDSQVEFQGSEGTVENITKNAYYILAISNAQSANGVATIAYNCRVRFLG